MEIALWRQQCRIAAGVPTVPATPVDDIDDWEVTDILIGELYQNSANGKFYSRTTSGIIGPFLTDTDLQTALDAIDALSDDLTQEILEREIAVSDLEDADVSLQNNIDDVADDLAQEVTDRQAAITNLLDGVASPGNTLQKLYNLITGSLSEVTVANIAARNAYDVTLGMHVLVTDDGDGNWALYKATTAGVGATFIKLSDPDLLNAVMSAAAIKSSYESNPDTNAFTNALLSKLNGIANGATANDTDANLLNRANHTGTQAATTITGTKTSSFISDFASTVIATVLTGLSTATNAVIDATDTVLSALGKLQKQISDFIAAQGSVIMASNQDESTAGMVNLTGMAFTLEANKNYWFEAHGSMKATSTNGGRFTVTSPSGAAIDVQIWGNNTSQSNFQSSTIKASATASMTFCAVASTDLIWTMRGSVQVGATPGTLQMQFRTLNAANTFTVYAGAVLKWKKIN